MEDKGLEFLQNESRAVSVVPNANFQTAQQGAQIKAAVEAALEKIKKENNQYIPLEFKIELKDGTRIVPYIEANGTLSDAVCYFGKNGAVPLTYDKLCVLPEINVEEVVFEANVTADKINAETFKTKEAAMEDCDKDDYEEVTEIITEEPKKQREKVIEKTGRDENTKEKQKEPTLGEIIQVKEKQTEMDKQNSEPIKEQEPVK